MGRRESLFKNDKGLMEKNRQENSANQQEKDPRGK
jgi:hypothetical protein